VFRSRNTRAGRFRPSRITRKCDACSRRRIGPRPLPVAAAARLGSTSRCRGSERGHQNACPNPASPSGQPLELRAGLLSCCFARPGVSGGSAAGPLVSGTGGWGGHAGWTRSLFTLSRPLVPDTSRPEGGPSGSSGRSIRRSLLSTCSLRAPPPTRGEQIGELLVGKHLPAMAARNPNMLPSGTRCPTSAAASNSLRSARSTPCTPQPPSPASIPGGRLPRIIQGPPSGAVSSFAAAVERRLAITGRTEGEGTRCPAVA
jgi:hypothetical protein